MSNPISRSVLFFSGYDYLIYIDEIVSGGMMVGHVREMLQLGIHKDINIIAVGLADDFGRRSTLKREKLQAWEKDGQLAGFLWRGCSSLITQDQKFLLGVHYVDYGFGPNVVPFITEQLDDHVEKIAFDAEVFLPLEKSANRCSQSINER